MTENRLQHTHLDGIADYTTALDTLCKLATHKLYLYEEDFDGLGFNSELRFETLRHFLLANPSNRLYMLAQNIDYLSTRCPRMGMLLRQFGNSLFIHQAAKHLTQYTEPFCVVDSQHYVRRFHFDDPRGLLAQNDPLHALQLESLYREMWANSYAGLHATTLGL